MSGKPTIYERSRGKLSEARILLGRIVVLLVINFAGFMAMNHGMLASGAPGVLFLVLLIFAVGLVARRSTWR